MMKFFSQLKYQMYCGREDAKVFWEKRGDEGVLHSVLYALTCHGWHVMILYRLGQIIYSIPVPILSHVLKIGFRLLHFVVSTFYGISVNPASEIGAGFYIGHYGGIFIRGKVGSYCSISQGVTFGSKGAGKSNGWPTLGDNVYIGAGAKVIGNIHLGDNVTVGANAVVTKSSPDNALLVGIPAVQKQVLKHAS